MATTTHPLHELPADHPGVHDQDYRARRAAIAEVGERYVPGEPIPEVTYTEVEHQVWQTVTSELARLHRGLACSAYLEGTTRLDLPTGRVPQLQEVSDRLRSLTGWRLQPVPGLVPTDRFYGALADRTFLSTQYLRHHSVPFYTPEPDILHELVGHANMLAEPRLAELCRLAGEASRRSTTPESLDAFSRVFWFSLEFGVLWERGELKAYGAGLLSSYGEIQVFRDAEVRPFDLRAMATTDYDITHYQPVLFGAGSFDEAYDALAEHFSTWDDDAHQRLLWG